MSHDAPILYTDDLRDALIRSGNVELHARSGADDRFAPILLQSRKSDDAENLEN